MLSNSSASLLPAAEAIRDLPPPPSESWLPSTLTEENLQDMEERETLPVKAISGWKCCLGQEIPSEDRT
jgi:hypothetical protein